jgi:transposase-like protein
LRKKVRNQYGEIEIQVPRDRNSTFEPVLVPKRKNMVDGIENIIISLYAKGMSVSNIEEQIKDLYHFEISSSAISRITDRVSQDAIVWQNRPLERMYCIVWINLLTEIKAKGVEDILVTATDNLKGFTEAIRSVFPLSTKQICIVHQIRNACCFVVWKDRKPFTADMKKMYTAPNRDAAHLALEQMESKWGAKYSYAVKSWKENWEELTAFLDFPVEIRKII